MRTIRYREIADAIRLRIEAGEFAAGRLLPSEAELGAAYEASRVTVRRSLEVLRDEGLVDSRQGFGWFVAADPLRQTLARLGTIEHQLTESGRASSRQVLEFGFVDAPPRAAAVLGAETVLEVRRRNLADGEPFALVTVWCPDDLGAELSRAAVERHSFLELLSVELGGATQTIGASVADAAEARPLDVPEGSPILRCERITRSADGRPVLLSEHVFPAHLTEFVVDLPHPSTSMAPSGLRLVDSGTGRPSAADIDDSTGSDG
jgi:GntR family transcriptional regulator